MEKLHKKNPIWSAHPNFWVFRGHSDDDKYKLIPTALRAEAHLGYSFLPVYGVQDTNQEQIDAEFEKIHEFYWSIDMQGLNVPGESNLLRTPKGWDELNKKKKVEGWPTSDLLPLLSIAQHHGIHTRLLDWSENSFIAAHFAARKPAKEKRKDGHISVWALNLDWIINEAYPSDLDEMPVYVVTAPRATNPNLHAQGGIFTTEKLKEAEFSLKTKVVPMNEIIESKWNSMGCANHVMAHIKLPSKESGRLLRLLNREHINSANLFPGYQGVAESLKEKEYWDIQERDIYWFKQ